MDFSFRTSSFRSLASSDGSSSGGISSNSRTWMRSLSRSKSFEILVVSIAERSTSPSTSSPLWHFRQWAFIVALNCFLNGSFSSALRDEGEASERNRIKKKAPIGTDKINDGNRVALTEWMIRSNGDLKNLMNTFSLSTSSIRTHTKLMFWVPLERSIMRMETIARVCVE